jgi:hypothetical protein
MEAILGADLSKDQGSSYDQPPESDNCLFRPHS